MSLLFYLMMMMRWFLGWHREVVFRLSLSAHLMERREIWDPPELNHRASAFLAIYCRFPLHILLLGPYNKSVHQMQTKVPADPYLFTRLRSPFPIVACALYAWLLLQTRGICQIVIAVSSQRRAPSSTTPKNHIFSDSRSLKFACSILFPQQ